MKLIIVVFFIAVFSSSCLSQPSWMDEVCFENVCVQVEVADTKSSRQLGLMFRQGLPEYQGMLFVFEKEGRYSFWMKNVGFFLDIIWIDKDKRIVDIKANVPPCNDSCEGLIPLVKAQYVLEVNAGFAQKNKIKIGDKVDFQDRERENP